MDNETMELSTLMLLKHFSTSGVAVTVATGMTHPIDVVKVKMQLEGLGRMGASSGLGKTMADLVREGGYQSFYRGVYPALLRASCYGSLRLGTYEPFKKYISARQERESLFQKILAGALAGSFATVITNPMDVLKVRWQGSTSAAMDKSLVRSAYNIVQKEGVTAMWKGVGPSMMRASSLTAAQCATYDECKHFIIERAGVSDGLSLHLSSSMLSGVIATAVSCPFDTVKVRMMMQNSNQGEKLYRNGLHCGYRILMTEGISGLYRGWSANYARLGPQTAITFIVYEKMREFVGMSGL